MILVLNSGSSTVKYQLIEPGREARRRGTVETTDHAAAVAQILAEVPADAIDGVGHRVVHGGDRFTAPTPIDDEVIAGIEALIPLAPLHNPGSLAGIRAAREKLPGVLHVAVFDTAFHATLPVAARTYAIDREVAAEWGIRRYGFHGTSYRYVCERTAELLGTPLGELNLIVLHLGNGASAAAVRGGRSVETSMGFTPLEGLVMGTRSGDLDPSVPGYLQRAAGLPAQEVTGLLERRSGLLGLAGDADMRAVLRRRAAGDEAAALAFDVYCHRLRKYVGAYHAVLGRVDAVVFTAGVGEHAAEVRAAALQGLEGWGIAVDPARNGSGDGARRISPPGAPVAVCVVPTDEELAIAQDVQSLLGGATRTGETRQISRQ
jgi:acetate kinase